MHNHQNTKNSPKRALIFALSITALMCVAEFIAGLMSNSLALLSDSGHMLTDTLALTLSLFAFILSQRPADSKKTYGYYRAEILAALFNGAILIAISLFIFYEAYRRFSSPFEIKAPLMLIVAIIGLIANIAGILVLKKHSQENLNVKGAFMHVLGDTISSVGVIAAAVIIYFTGFKMVDPLVSCLIAIIILRSALSLVVDSGNILLEAMPKHINPEDVTDEIKNIKGIQRIHDLHIWAISSGIYALSGHLVIDDVMVSKSGEMLKQVNNILKEKFHIEHTTLQLECLHCKDGLICPIDEI